MQVICEQGGLSLQDAREVPGRCPAEERSQPAHWVGLTRGFRYLAVSFEKSAATSELVSSGVRGMREDIAALRGRPLRPAMSPVLLPAAAPVNRF